MAVLLGLAMAMPAAAAADDEDEPIPAPKPPVRRPVAKVAAPADDEPPAKIVPAKNVPAKAAPGKPKEPPAPIELKGSELLTKDGMMLQAIYFPSPKSEENGKEVVPVILLHGWKGQGSQMLGLAEYLQSLGHAVLVPDLRGHGKSTQWKGGAGKELDPAKMPLEQFERMVHVDMEKFKSFLLQRNNAGELNMDKLCIVGADMGAMIAMQWAMKDWSWPQYPGLKQGQYVKGLVLISPPWTFKNLDAKGPLSHPALRNVISVQIFVGKQEPKAKADAERIKNAIEKFRREDGPAEETQDFFFKGLETKLQGANMLGVRGLDLEKRIAAFIELRLVRKDFPWQDSSRKQ